jgi:Raf kinase inhibitor-like YbhB/YbcL family protein
LSWSALPEETASIAVTCEDPEGPAGPFTLWILFNVPAGLSGIPEGVSKVPLPPEIPGAEQGINDTGNTGYDGPAPPRGHPAHRYVFRVLALDALLALPPGVTRATFEASAGGHVLAQGRIVGTFSR